MIPTMTSVTDSEAQREANRLREADLQTVPGVRIKLSDVDALIELGVCTGEEKKDLASLAKLVAKGFSRHVDEARRQRLKQAEDKAAAESGGMTIGVSAHALEAMRQQGFLWGQRPYAIQTVLDALRQGSNRGFTLDHFEKAELDQGRQSGPAYQQVPVSQAFAPSGDTGRGASNFSMGPRR
jgi:hypothetical protein